MARPQPTFSIASDMSSTTTSHYAEIAESASSDQLITHNAHSISISDDDKPTRAGKSGCTCVMALAVISLIVSTLCLVCIGVFAWFLVQGDVGDLLPWMSASQTQETTDRATEVCLPCLQVSPDPLSRDVPSDDLWSELDVRMDKENATKICCATNTAQYAALFKLIVQRQEEVKKLADTLDATGGQGDRTSADTPQTHSVPSHAVRSPSAHFTFKPSPWKAKMDTVQRWQTPQENPLSHEQRGVKLVDNRRLIVDTPGLYFIYCQIYTTPHSGDPADADSGAPRQSFYVTRYSVLRSADSTILLKARHTRHSPDTDRHSSYVGGVFRLHKGDTLSVEVARPELVAHDILASFFGLFRVGG